MIRGYASDGTNAYKALDMFRKMLALGFTLLLNNGLLRKR